MYSYIVANQLKVNNRCKEELLFLYRKYMNHEFDLLGSGFQKVCYGMPVKGFRGVRYEYHRKFLYEKNRMRFMDAISKDYEPINWFIDYKSGFYFEPAIYSTPKKCLEVIEKKKAVDIKCPLELGRFYHVVQLAVLAVADSDKAQQILKQYRDEVYDFIHTNPVGKTVQWSCPMDSAIRIVNLLIAYDILKQMDSYHVLDSDFENAFHVLIYESAKYVLEHLEYDGRRGAWNGNHYLSDLIGVLYATAYLNRTDETDAWLVFATQELIDQFDKQFNEDGTNFEGSTSYQRFSTEIVLYATALIYGVLKTNRKTAFEKYDNKLVERLLPFNRQKYSVKDSNFFPEWYLNRLYKAGRFTKVILKQNNEIVQIGDNDSGRIVKLTPVIENQTYQGEENVLDHRTLLSGLAALYGIDKDQEGDIFPLEYSLIEIISRGKHIRISELEPDTVKTFQQGKIESNFEYKKVTSIYSEGDDTAPLLGPQTRCYYYKYWGLIVVRSERMFMSFIVGNSTIKLKNKFQWGWGHTHNDALSLELLVDGNYITRDPGTYIYTASPSDRNKFRSTMAHNTIHVNNYEQNDFNGTWEIRKKSEHALLCCNNDRILAKVQYHGVEHIRKVEIGEHFINVTDYCNQPFTVGFQNRMISTGYGKIVKGK